MLRLASIYFCTVWGTQSSASGGSAQIHKQFWNHGDFKVTFHDGAKDEQAFILGDFIMKHAFHGSERLCTRGEAIEKSLGIMWHKSKAVGALLFKNDASVNKDGFIGFGGSLRRMYLHRIGVLPDYQNGAVENFHVGSKLIESFAYYMRDLEIFKITVMPDGISDEIKRKLYDYYTRIGFKTITVGPEKWKDWSEGLPKMEAKPQRIINWIRKLK